MIAVRLHAYMPGRDDDLGFMPDPLSTEVSFVHNGDGALVVKYSSLSDGGAIAARTLEQGLDVAYELNFGSGWVEPDGGRFLMVDREVDPTDPTKLIQLTFVSYSWLLNKILNLNTAKVEGTKSAHAGMRKFSKKDAGDIIKTFLDEHDARPGAPVPIVRSSWTATSDSLGQPWAKQKTVYYSLGQDLHSILDALASQDMCDWRMRGRGLRIFNADTAFTDRSDLIVLDYGADLAEAPSAESLRDVIGRVLVKGENKKKVTVDGTGAPANYGLWEGFIDDGGVDETDDLTADGNAELTAKAKIRGEYTRALTMAGDFLPLRDYVPGDWITAPAISGRQRMRVQQVTISTSADGGPTGSIILNDRVLAGELERASKLAQIGGGAGSGSSTVGSGTITNPAEPDSRQASAPTNVQVSTSLSLSDRWWSAAAALTWDPVTTATDGTPLDVAGYQVWALPPGGVWHVQATVTSPEHTFTRLQQGSTWQFAIAAVPATALWPSAQTFTAAILMPSDTIPPNQPSAPTVVSEPASVSVTWDGLDSAGAAMPADFDRVDVLMDTSNPPLKLVAQMPAGGQYVGLAEVHSTMWVSLVAYDTTGNASAATTPVSVVVKSVLDDAGLEAALATRPRFYTPESGPGDETPIEASWWLKADGSLWRFISGSWTAQTFDAEATITAGTIVASLIAAAAVTAEKIAADAVTADKIYAGAVTAAKIAAGAIEADKLQAGAIDGFVITGAIIRTAASGQRVQLDSSGLHGYDAGGVERTKVGTDGKLVADSGTFTNATITGSLTATSVEGLSLIQALSSSSNAKGKLSPGSVEVSYSNDIIGGSAPVNSAQLRGNGLVLWGGSGSTHFGWLKLNDNPTMGYGMSLHSDTDLSIGAWGEVSIGSYPKAFVGRLAGDRSLTASNYTSFKTTSIYETNVADSSWITWNGDALVIPEPGWYELVVHAQFDNSSTSGNRLLMLLKNFTSNTYNSSTAPAESYRLREQKLAASTDFTTCELVWRGRLNDGDRLHFLARSTTAVGLDSGYRTGVSLELRGA